MNAVVPERRVGDRRCNDPSCDPNLIHLTAGKLCGVLLLVWLTSILASGGVGWYFAGRSAQETTQALRSSSVSGQQSLYLSSLGRCLTGSTFRSQVIHNSILQKKLMPLTIIPTKGELCSKQIPDPGVATATLTVIDPADSTQVG